LTTQRKRKLVAVVVLLLLGGYVAAGIALTELRYRFYLRDVGTFGMLDFAGLRGSPTREACQFVWLHSMGPRMLIRVVVQDDEHATLTLKVPDIQAPGPMRIDRTVELSAEQIQELRRVVDAHPFWRERLPWGLTPDGALWKMEVKRLGRHHLGIQSSAEKGGIQDIGRHLTALSGCEFLAWMEPR
jgi:hypothetical protein